MFQPIMIYLKSGEVGFCTLKYSDVTDLKNQVDSLSMSDDVDKVLLESHLPVLEMEKIKESLTFATSPYSKTTINTPDKDSVCTIPGDEG